MVRFWLPWTALAGAWLLALALLSPCDLTLALATHRAGSGFGWFVLCFGELPSWLLIAAALAGLLAMRQGAVRLRRWRPLAWAIVLQGLLHPLLLTQTLKFFWGRIRFVDLPADLVGYTPFIIPAGPFAGESFPSGHVAMAALFAPLVVFLWRRGRRRLASAAGILALGWVATVAAGRMVAGAHYATDCLFSAGIAALLSAVLLHRLDRDL